MLLTRLRGRMDCDVEGMISSHRASIIDERFQFLMSHIVEIGSSFGYL